VRGDPVRFRAEDYVGWKRDSRAETVIAERLRELPEQERFDFIQQFLAVSVDAALSLANRCLRERIYFEAFLRQGVLTADISSIGGWIDAVAATWLCARRWRIGRACWGASEGGQARSLRAGRHLKTADQTCRERVAGLAKRVE
jgi:hypothetical protein